MSSGNVYERLFKLEGTIAKLVMDGKRDPEKVADVFQTIVDEKTSTTKTSSRSILRLLTPNLVIPPTAGTENLSDVTVFSGWVDPDLANWGCNVASEPKPGTSVAVYELPDNGTFQQIFVGQGVDLDQLCLTPHQIKLFVINHREHLHPQGYATFFLFKVAGQFFVADVYWSDARRLRVYVYRLAFVGVWCAGARHRVVLPATGTPALNH